MPTEPIEPQLRRIATEANQLAEHIDTLAKNLDSLRQEKGMRLADYAELFVCSRMVNDVLDTARKNVGKVRDTLSYTDLPELFEDEGITNYTTASGYRVVITTRTSVSMIDKEAGMEWLRNHELSDLIIETVNSSSLSAQVRQMMEEEGIEPPSEIFKVSVAPYTSMTKVKK